jgi:hypothetical protein
MWDVFRFIRRCHIRIAVLLLALAGIVALGKSWVAGYFGAGTDGRLGAELAELPGYDYVEESRKLYEQERYEEALVVIEAGFADPDSDQATLARLRDVKNMVTSAMDSWVTKGYNFGKGAVTGKADTVEGLAGSVIADFFVIGDIRDLAVQGYNWTFAN